MGERKSVRWLKGLAHFWKDLLLLVLGIYLALWMENTVEGWNNDKKQRDYMHRLSLDLASDESQIEALLPQLNLKITKLQSGIHFLQSPDLDHLQHEAAKQALDIANAVNNYYFFTPQDFTFLSMRESGDFGLLVDDNIKTELLQLNARYKFINLLQKNFMQGLDDEFIPMWIRHADMVSNTLLKPEIITTPIFKNMVAFAYNETNQRKIILNETIQRVKELRIKLQIASQQE